MKIIKLKWHLPSRNIDGVVTRIDGGIEYFAVLTPMKSWILTSNTHKIAGTVFGIRMLSICVRRYTVNDNRGRASEAKEFCKFLLIISEKND